MVFRKKIASAALLALLLTQQGTFSSLPIVETLVDTVAPFVEASNDDFVRETAEPKYGKTFLSTIVCKNGNGSNVGFGAGYDNQDIRVTVNQAIQSKNLPYTQIPAESAIHRSDGAWFTNENIDTVTMNAVCAILGYDTYVSSDCRDRERSGNYPAGKCNFHSPHNNYHDRFVGTVKLGTTVAISKEILNKDPQGYEPGETIGFRINTENTGNAKAQNITVIDVLPAGLVFEPNGSTDTCQATTTNNRRVECTHPLLNAGSVKNFIINARLTNNIDCSTQIQNTATVKFDDGFGTHSNDTNTVNTNVHCRGDMSVEKEILSFQQNGYEPGSTITFRVNTSNTSNVQTQDLKVIDVLPAGLVFEPNGSTDTCQATTANSRRVECTHPQLNPGGNKNFIIKAHLTNNIDCATPIQNTATLQFNDNFGTVNKDSNTVDASVRCRGGMNVNKEILNQQQNGYAKGDIITYRVNTSNNSNTSVQNIRVVDILDSNLEFVADGSTDGCTLVNARRVECTHPSLVSGGNKNFIIKARVKTTAACNVTVHNDAQLTFHDGYNNVQLDSNTVSASLSCIAACSDGIDNDNDGAADYPNDFSCSGPNDDDEANPKSQCQDGIDNDNDGRVDGQDPGCENNQDNSERNPNGPQCDNGRDDDNDGKTDYPADPDCSGPNDDTENNPNGPACSDGIDNDGDGKVDYRAVCDNTCVPQEISANGTSTKTFVAGCDGQLQINTANDDVVVWVDQNAVTRKVVALCDDEINYLISQAGQSGLACDNCTYTADRNGNNYSVTPASGNGRNCPDITSKRIAVKAGDRVTLQTWYDGSSSTPSWVKFIPGCTLLPTDPECSGPNDNNEGPDVFQCNDGIDNDGDGAVDGADFSCSGPNDDDETNPKSQCQDGIDNDGDGVIDSQDPGCTDNQDNSENSDLGRVETISPLGDITDTTPTYVWKSVPGAADYDLWVSLTSTPSVALIREFTTNTSITPSFALTPGVSYSFWVRARTANTFGPWSAVKTFRVVTACSNGIDDDGDGLADGQDPGCSGPNDDDERDPNGPQCDNGRDDDNDGKTDYPADPDCSGPTDPNEGSDNADMQLTMTAQPTQAAKGSQVRLRLAAKDNGPANADTVVVRVNVPFGFTYEDGISDTICEQIAGVVECPIGTIPKSQTRNLVIGFTVATNATCGGTTQFNASVSTSSQDPNNSNNNVTASVSTTCTQCSDGIDNDGDGATDYGADFSCSGPNDDDETNPKSQCQDGIDNDGDGVIDSQDPGCTDNQDNSENSDLGRVETISPLGDITDTTPTYVWKSVPGAVDYDLWVSVTSTPSVALIREFTTNTSITPSFALTPGVSYSFWVRARTANTFGPWSLVKTFRVLPPATQCSDGIDNDGDGLIDFGQDPGCTDSQDNSENSDIGAPVMVSPSGDISEVQPTYTWQGVTGAVDYELWISLSSQTNVALYQQFIGSNATSFKPNFTLTPGVRYAAWVRAKSADGTLSSWSNSVAYIVRLPECNDGIDNDGDGATDYPADPGCDSATDNTEKKDIISVTKVGPSSITAGQTVTYKVTVKNTSSSETALNVRMGDYFPNDPLDAGFVYLPQQSSSECALSPIAGEPQQVVCGPFTYGPNQSRTFTLVYQTPANQNCSATIMNQADVDSSNADTAWTKVMTPVNCVALPQCSDGIDNDGDGAADYGADFSCSGPNDDDETNPKSQCQDGIDNDGDGVIDSQDPGCENNQDNSERNPNGPQCDNGADDDNDGKADYPLDPGCTGPTDNDETDPQPKADLGILKIGPSTVTKGSTVTYNVYVQNFGPDTASNVIVSDVVPAGLTFNSGLSSNGCALQSGVVRCQTSSLTKNNSAGFSVVFDVTNAAVCNGTISNTATVSADTVDPDTTNNTSQAVGSTVQCALPQCSDGIDNDGDGAADYGADFSCSGPNDDDETNPKSQCQDGIDNDGDGFADSQDPGCENNQDNSERNPNGPQCDNGADDDNDGKADYPLDPGCTGPTDNDESNVLPACSDGIDNDGDGFADFGYDYSCSSPDDNDEEFPKAQCQDGIDNDGDGVIDSQDPGCENSQDDNEFNQILHDLYITKSGPVKIKRGNTIIYTLTATNLGPHTATNVHILDEIPAGLTFDPTNSSSNCVRNGSTIICNNFSLPNQDSRTVNVAFTVSTGLACGSSIRNVGIVNTSATDLNPKDNRMEVFTEVDCSGENPVLNIFKTDNRTNAAPGETLNYTITVTNSSNFDATGVDVSDNLPPQVEYVNATYGPSVQTQSSNVVVLWSGLTVPANQSITLNLTAKVKNDAQNGSVMLNTAQINGGASASDSTTVEQNQSQVGCVEIYKIAQYYNGGTVSPVPAFTFRISGTSLSTTNDTNGYARINNVPVGQQIVTEDSLNGWSQLSVVPSGGAVNVTSGTQCAQLTFTNRESFGSQQPTYAITKTDNVGAILPGQTLTYTINVTNTSSVPAASVRVVDILPPELSFLSADNNGTLQNGEVVWNNLSLNPGQSISLHIQALVRANVAPNTVIFNIAQVIGTSYSNSYSLLADSTTQNTSEATALDTTTVLAPASSSSSSSSTSSYSSVSSSSSYSSSSTEYEDDVVVNDNNFEEVINPFNDTDMNTLEGQAAADLYYRGVIGGFSDNTFRGVRYTNRAEIAKFILLARYGSVSDVQNNGQFSDVKNGEWYVKYVITAAIQGIVTGYNDGTFRPGNPINTKEFLSMITHAFGLEQNLPYNYTDVDANDWGATYAGVAQKYNLFPDRTTQLAPNSALSRKDVAIALYQLLKNQ